MYPGNGLRSALVLALAACSSACVTSRVEETKNAATGLAATESVVVLSASYHKGKTTEGDFVECVNEELHDDRGVHIYPGNQFRDDLFPYLEPRTMPQGVDSLPDLLARPGVPERIAASGVRYVVWLSGSTEETSGGGGMSCAAGPTGGGCFGLAWWEDEGDYKASVWDLRSAQASGQVSANTHGTSMVPALILPLPLIARTQATACKALVEELNHFLLNSGPG